MVTREARHGSEAGTVETTPRTHPPEQEPARTTGGDPAGDAGRRPPPPGSVAAVLAPLLSVMVGGSTPVRFEFWDGSGVGPTEAVGTLEIRSPDALRRILWAPGELGVARAFVAGDITVDGDLFGLLRALRASSPGIFARWGCRRSPPRSGPPGAWARSGRRRRSPLRSAGRRAGCTPGRAMRR